MSPVTVADTAFSIAIVRAEESARPAGERLFEDPHAALFEPSEPEAREATARFLELPVFREAVRLRTRFIDDFVRQGLADGIDQVVLYGAGFDCRGLRLPEVSAHGARVYEVDFAGQLEKKRALLARAAVALPPWVAHVPADFNSDFEGALADALVRHGFRRGGGALFVWEGVIAYLDNRAIDRSLAFMANIGGPRTRVVFDYGPMLFDSEPAETRMHRAGFASFEESRIVDLWRRHLGGEPHPHAVVSMGVASL
jgi:methyltransferase (TIGR00027 family)